ncbi:MAG: hypothetical protein PWR09_1090, partial [Archaeoglobi archaeon]|nr:hypothetical protein [Archaeoglobi archaeon]
MDEKTLKLLEERRDRLVTAYKGGIPDRVPITANCTTFHAKYAGYTVADVAFDYEKNINAFVKTAKDFPGIDSFGAFVALEGMIFCVALFQKSPEIAGTARFITGPFHAILKDCYTRWPGMELDVNAHPQFIGKEIMKRDEYDQLIENPVEFINKVALPRICESLRDPGSPEYNSAMVKYGLEIQKSTQANMKLAEELGKLGYPAFPMGYSYAPLDLIGDFLRDIKNIILDIFRMPDTVKDAAEAVTPVLIDAGLATSAFPKEMMKQLGHDIIQVMYPLHLNEYLNPEQYKEFYWPYLKKVNLAHIEAGRIPWVFFEGEHKPHLETLKEIPKGKLIAMFEKTDPYKIREVLGDHLPIIHGIKNAVLIGGTASKVEEEVKRVMDALKDDGGFVFNIGVDGGLSRDAKPE